MSEKMIVPGIHHVTALASDPQRNLDFYTQVLGMRLVKLTVNFDDPGTYHLYFGDKLGHPGTILTFFPRPKGRKGQRGSGQAAITAFSIPENSLAFWEELLKNRSVQAQKRQTPFGETVLSFEDPDGLSVVLVERTVQGGESDPDNKFFGNTRNLPTQVSPWEGTDVPVEFALSGVHGLTLWEENPEPTINLLGETLGLRLLEEKTGLFRMQSGTESQPGILIDVRQMAGAAGRMGAGVVHHIAWRTRDKNQQLDWREKLLELGLHVTQVYDRQYFHSIYFREPGGVLFEIATDGPGFKRDENVDELGRSLKLPEWLEPKRAEILETLPDLRLPVEIARE